MVVVFLAGVQSAWRTLRYAARIFSCTCSQAGSGVAALDLCLLRYQVLVLGVRLVSLADNRLIRLSIASRDESISAMLHRTFLDVTDSNKGALLVAPGMKEAQFRLLVYRHITHTMGNFFRRLPTSFSRSAPCRPTGGEVSRGIRCMTHLHFVYTQLVQ